jgi:hypothetical protein
MDPNLPQSSPARVGLAPGDHRRPEGQNGARVTVTVWVAIARPPPALLVIWAGVNTPIAGWWNGRALHRQCNGP